MDFYNDNDPKAAAWLRELIAAGHLPPGDVSDASIGDLTNELHGRRQVHLFAGIGGWPLSLRLAGWPGDRPVWTGSCPCQPFSSAGKGRGVADERHLWPVMLRHIAEHRPPTVLGEQVASAAGREWLSGVRADLEALGYAVGAADLCAAGVGAPHIRQRLYWVADASGADVRRQREHGDGTSSTPESGAWERQRCGHDAWARGTTRGLADAQLQREGRGEQGIEGRKGIGGSGFAVGGSDDRGLGDAAPSGRTGIGWCGQERAAQSSWDDYRLVACRDPRHGIVYRRASTQSSAFPLAHGVPARVVRLRGYGNAIVPQLAATFVRAYLTL